MQLFQDNASIATELIDHQYNNQEFKEELIKAFSDIETKISSGEYRSTTEIVLTNKETKTIQQAIAKRIGIQLVFEDDPGIIESEKLNAGVNYYRNNIFTPLLNNTIRTLLANNLDKLSNEEVDDTDYLKYLKVIKKEPTEIDLKAGRVSGGLSKVPCRIVFDIYGLITVSKMTAGELAAILIHEIGHVFNAIYFEHKLSVLNQALYNIHTYKDLKDKEKTFKIVYSELKSVDNTLTEKQVRDILSGNIILSSFALYKFINKTTGMDNLSLDLDTKNDLYNSESLADIFAVRMGFGSDLFSALTKLKKSNVEIVMAGSVIIYNSLMISFLTLTFAPIIASTLFLLNGIVVLIIIMTARKTIDANIPYKHPKERLQKILNDYIDSVKQSKNPEYKKEAIEVVKTFKLLISKMPEKHSTLDKVLDTIFRYDVKPEAYATQQDILERLASNELFIKAIELELLTKD